MALSASRAHNVLYKDCILIPSTPSKWGFPGGSIVKNLPAISGDMCLVPELERPLGGGRGNPLQYSCLENPMDRGAWWATVCKVE